MQFVAIIPHDRPEFSDNVAKLCRMLAELGWTSIVVANGCEYDGPCDHLVTIPERGLSRAMRAGICRAIDLGNPAEIVAAKLDSDDDYAPSFFAAVERAFAMGAEWTGHETWLVRLLDGTVWREGTAGSRACAGGTLAASLDVFAPYPDYLPDVADDKTWCERMRRRRFIPSDSNGYLRVRRPGPSVDRRTDADLRIAGLRHPVTGKRCELTDADNARLDQQTRSRMSRLAS